MTLENEAAPVATNDAPMSETPSTAPVDATEASFEAAPQDIDATLRDVWAKNHPERDATGRFRGRQPAPDSAEAETEVSPDQSPDAEQKQALTPAIQPPQSWSAEEKAEWATLTPKAQEAIARREREATQALSRLGNEVKSVEPIKHVVEQYQDVFQRNGVTAEDGISRLLAANRALEDDPYSAIATLAEAYGVDLNRFANGQQSAGNVPPEVGQLHQRIAYLESKLNETSNRIVQREQAEATTQAKSMETLIEKFSSEKSDWSDLETDVLAELVGINAAISERIIQPMSAEDKLAKAYDRALKNNPDAWSRKQEADRKAAEAKRVEEARKRTEAARMAKSVNVGTTPGKGVVVQSMDDTLREAFRKAQSAR